MTLPTWAIGIASALIVSGLGAVLTIGRGWDQELVVLRRDVVRIDAQIADVRKDMQANAYVRPAPETLARLVASEREIAEIKRRLEALEHRRSP